jgi:hypothetical protein
MGKRKKEERIYLAGPYTCREYTTLRMRRQIENERFRLITQVSILLVERGIAHFSPITQSHIQKKVANDIGITFLRDWEFWESFDLAILRGCTELYIAVLPGWIDSVGVNAETKEAKRLKKPISYVTYNEEEQTITIMKESVTAIVRPELPCRIKKE